MYSSHVSLFYFVLSFKDALKFWMGLGSFEICLQSHKNTIKRSQFTKGWCVHVLGVNRSLIVLTVVTLASVCNLSSPYRMSSTNNSVERLEKSLEGNIRWRPLRSSLIEKTIEKF